MPTFARPRITHGFTLIELMIALAVIAILASIALPSYRDSIDAAHSDKVRVDVVTSVQRAITQAIANGEQSVLCPSTNGQSCDSSSDWSQGWIGFLDGNQNREHDAGEFMLDVTPALPDGVRMTTSVGRTRLLFQPSGSNGGSNVRFTICDRRGPEAAQSLVLNNKGRLHSDKALPDRIENTCPQG